MGSKPLQSSKNVATVLTLWYGPLRGETGLASSTPYCVKEMFIHRLLEFKSQPSSVSKWVFFRYIYRLLGKYSLLDAFNGFENDDIFMSKFSWRRLVRANMETDYEADRCLKSVNSENAKSVMRITEPNREYLLWKISREFPKYT